MNIFIDLETCPSQDPDVRAQIAASITAPGNYSKPESISKWEAENKPALVEEAWRKTAFDGALGHICVAGIAIDDEEPEALYADEWLRDERSVIASLFNRIKDASSGNRRLTFIGHNLVEFDLRFLFQRAVVLGIRPPAIIPFKAKPWDDTVFDTMSTWSGLKDRVSLDKLCRVLGIAAKGTEIGEEIDGSKVWEFVKAGRIADVATYCKGDIERTRHVYKRMTFAGLP